MQIVDHGRFFAGYRAEFGSLKQPQMDGLTDLLDMIGEDEGATDPRRVAYLLATIKHECADRWEPVTEFGRRNYFDKYNAGTPIGRRLGNTEPDDGYRFRGRGYVQITGRANYQRLGDRLGFDLVGAPDKALLPEIAYRIAVAGMSEGLFTGKTLDDYITPTGCDYVGARRIINGTDKALLIAGYARQFERILRASTDEATMSTTTDTTAAPLVDQPTAKPTRKVTAGSAGGGAGALAGLLLAHWIKGQFGIEVPDDLAAAAGADALDMGLGLAEAAGALIGGGLGSLSLGWLTRDRATR